MFFKLQQGLSFFNPRVNSRLNFPEEEGGDYQNCEKRVKYFLHYIFVMFIPNSRAPDPRESPCKKCNRSMEYKPLTFSISKSDFSF